MNLIYVDDDLDDHLFLKKAIGALVCDCKLTSLCNGLQLLDYLFKTGKFKNTVCPVPDLILLDINMPVMNGISVLRTIKSIGEFKHLPIFILTTSKDEDSIKECIRLGAEGFYTKPILIKDLENLMQDIIVKTEDTSNAYRG